MFIKIDYYVGNSILITSWHLKFPNKRIRTSNRKKPLKGTKEVRKVTHRINGAII